MERFLRNRTYPGVWREGDNKGDKGNKGNKGDDKGRQEGQCIARIISTNQHS